MVKQTEFVKKALEIIAEIEEGKISIVKKPHSEYKESVNDYHQLCAQCGKPLFYKNENNDTIIKNWAIDTKTSMIVHGWEEGLKCAHDMIEGKKTYLQLREESIK